MVELTCPACGDVRVLPFVRVAAVVRCPACGHVWRVSASHVRKVPRAGAGAAAAAGASPSGGRPGPEPKLGDEPPAEDARAGSSVTGLSGLTEIMQAEPRGPAAGQPPVAPLPEALVRAETPDRRASRRVTILVVSLLALGVAAGGIVLAVTLPRLAPPAADGNTPSTPADATEPGGDSLAGPPKPDAG
ncbi:MAG: hypothetical protein AAF710_08765 [Planctomycetota bacterium]